LGLENLEASIKLQFLVHMFVLCRSDFVSLGKNPTSSSIVVGFVRYFPFWCCYMYHKSGGQLQQAVYDELLGAQASRITSTNSRLQSLQQESSS
jgi:hypothetical protein